MNSWIQSDILGKRVKKENTEELKATLFEKYIYYAITAVLHRKANWNALMWPKPQNKKGRTGADL